MKPDQVPTPFSSEDLRIGCAPGRSNTYRVEAAGETPRLITTTWLGHDADGGEAAFSSLALDGTPLDAPAHRRTDWRELQAHAAYPEGATTIEEASAETPAGEFDAWLYTVERRDGREPTVERAWFAKDLPGPPVLRIDEVEGREVFRMTLIEVVDPRRS
jgi:hypothetical protein